MDIKTYQAQALLTDQVPGTSDDEGAVALIVPMLGLWTAANNPEHSRVDLRHCAGSFAVLDRRWRHLAHRICGCFHLGRFHFFVTACQTHRQGNQRSNRQSLFHFTSPWC
jgi:hypothetical protein